jgi:cell division protease FtsH
MGRKDSDEFGGDGNFQIIKNSMYTFADIGGYDNIKTELLQTADILINYEKYRKYNVRTPKGMIFEGPPGNGKTLMAKGFSGELNVSFIPVSGSEFSEKYVGVGASRVRELFKLAEENKPCIIFIDEIDALARKRGNDMVSSNSEKDQTLNQLLINLDGFKHSNGIFVIGATNRMDLLDPALVRAGRMDKNIFIGNPDADTRRAILRIHVKGKPLSHDVSMSALVEMTGGFSGAQIENLLNEAMLRALRENREIIQMNDLEYITNRVLAGWQSTESKYSEDIIHRIAIHEMGHAVVGFFSEAHPRLSKIYLNLWSPKRPGYTVFESNDEDVNIYTKEGLFSHLMVLLGGRIAEELFFGYSVTTGARKDLDEAYKLAQNMIIQYGMGKQTIYPDLSDQSKYLIDQEVNMLLVKANDAAVEILTKSKAFMLECAKQLKETHTLKAEQMVDIVRVGHLDLWKEYNVTRYLM